MEWNAETMREEYKAVWRLVKLQSLHELHEPTTCLAPPQSHHPILPQERAITAPCTYLLRAQGLLTNRLIFLSQMGPRDLQIVGLLPATTHTYSNQPLPRPSLALLGCST